MVLFSNDTKLLLSYSSKYDICLYKVWIYNSNWILNAKCSLRVNIILKYKISQFQAFYFQIQSEKAC